MSGDPAVEAPRQQTIGAPFVLEGTGLHSGQPAYAEVRPAEADTGIVFCRSDLRDEPVIRADVELVSGVEWETVLGPS
ncbi:MAG: UDP-3-O-acyl-N-acetylglucosamine deacetylase, partial [Gemmatimonadota bacterium]